ncbi:MAG: CBS domain-containing protein [Wenzhouxiangella sp.]
MLRSIQIADYMNPAPVKVHVDDSLIKAADLITSQRVSGACVVDSDDCLVGMLSEIDCLRAVISATYNNTADIGTVREAMTAEVQCCARHDNIVDVAMDMISKGHRRRPVVEHGRLVGQLTCRQILRVVSSFNESLRA